MLPAFATVLRATKAPLLPSLPDEFLRSTVLPPPALYGGVQGPPVCSKPRSNSPSSETSSCSETSVPEGLMMISRYLEGFKSERPARENRKFEFDSKATESMWVDNAHESLDTAKKRERCTSSLKDSGLERTILRSGIERLQSMLPPEGKAKLAEVIRLYLKAQVSPETFAGEIYRLADDCRLAHRGSRRHAPSNRPTAAPGGDASAIEIAPSRRVSKKRKVNSGAF
jgi:hypothetical protein